ncbi:hypothetical protein M4S82_01575 [Planococcus sp. MERTA32b]|nr:hypothetical protein [Planococcus sp. MER TA 32b]
MAILFAAVFGISILFSVIALFYAVIVHDWKSFFLLGLVLLPVSIYTFSGEMPVQIIGLLSIACFVVSAFLFFRNKRKEIL